MKVSLAKAGDISIFFPLQTTAFVQTLPPIQYLGCVMTLSDTNMWKLDGRVANSCLRKRLHQNQYGKNFGVGSIMSSRW